MGVNVRERVLLRSTRTLEERSNAAGTCLLHLGIKLPAVLDQPDDAVERAYTGWPDRLYVIDTTGRVAYKSAAGPFGFKAEELEAALARISPPVPAHSADLSYGKAAAGTN
jgi:type I thyroxine 5'-deiodinase